MTKKLLIILVIILIVIGGVITYIGIKQGNTKLAAKDCGLIGVSVNEPTIVNRIECFNNNFSLCVPAVLAVNQDFLGIEVGYRYEVLGPSGNKCLVNERFTKNPNPIFIGKDRTCSYDNSENFLTPDGSSSFNLQLSFNAELGGQSEVEINKNECYGTLQDLFESPESFIVQ